MNNTTLQNINALGLLGLSIILIVALVLQLVWNELPCPLCLLQRVGFCFVMYGLFLNIKHGLSIKHYGIALLGAVFGGIASLRQVSLHVIPGTPPYGSAIFGFHFYTWAFILFGVTIIIISLLMILQKSEAQESFKGISHFNNLIGLIAMISIFVTLIATFIECGPFQCPDNPVSYWLIDLLSS